MPVCVGRGTVLGRTQSRSKGMVRLKEAIAYAGSAKQAGVAAASVAVKGSGAFSIADSQGASAILSFTPHHPLCKNIA